MFIDGEGLDILGIRIGKHEFVGLTTSLDSAAVVCPATCWDSH